MHSGSKYHEANGYLHDLDLLNVTCMYHILRDVSVEENNPNSTHPPSLHLMYSCSAFVEWASRPRDF